MNNVFYRPLFGFRFKFEFELWILDGYLKPDRIGFGYQKSILNRIWLGFK